MKRVGIFSIMVALIAGMIGYAPRPIEIRDWYDLHAIRNDLAGSYILMNDLDSATAGYMELASETANGRRGWEPIGTPDDEFTGSFDGQGYEIRDLFINRPGEDYVGLFAHISWIRHIDNVGVVENVGMVNAEVSGSAEVGALVGHNAGIVNNSYSSSSVSGDSRVGGLVGMNYYGSATNSYSTGSATGSSQVGGLVGYNTGTVSNSFWDRTTSGVEVSDGGTRKTTVEMMDIATFSGAGWNIITVADLGTRNPAYIWNIVDGQTYPFLRGQSVS